MIRSQDIVCISTTEWEYPWGSRQQLMTRFAQANRVLFVEYQSSFLHTLFGRGEGRPRDQARLRSISDNLYVYAPKWGLPFGYYSLAVNEINQRVLCRQIRALIRLLSFSEVVLWIYAPCSLGLIGRLGEDISIYHAIDLYKEEIDNRVRRKVIQALERRHVPAADLVFASSRKIFDYLKGLNSNVSLYPSATDGSVDSDNLTIKPPVPKVAGPIVGFVGTIDERFNYDLIDYLSTRNPEVTYVIVGPIVGVRLKQVLSAMADKKNVVFPGKVERALVPAYIKTFDVCLLPYRKNAFTDAISPIKVYEYLLQGKPVVATDLDGLSDLGDTIYRAKHREEFDNLIRIALTERDDQVVSKRIRLAKQNTWDHRYWSMSKLIGDYLSSKARRVASASAVG